jgi:hypothetical protein
MNRFDLIKKPILVAMAVLTLVMASSLVSSTTLASAQTRSSGNPTLVSMGNDQNLSDSESTTPVSGGIVNWLAYIWSFLREIAGHLFMPGDVFRWTRDVYGEWVLAEANIPEMTPTVKDMVGSLVTVVHNYLVYRAQYSTLLPAQSSPQQQATDVQVNGGE